jgi:hypothetical protein
LSTSRFRISKTFMRVLPRRRESDLDPYLPA